MKTNNLHSTQIWTWLLALLGVLALSGLVVTQISHSQPDSASSVGYPGPSTPTGLRQPGTATATALGEANDWWKRTETANIATLSAAATPVAVYVDVPTDPTPIQFLKRPAGDGMIVTQANPRWLERFVATSAWVTKTADKYVAVYVGLQLSASSSEMQVVVAWFSLKDLVQLPGGGTYRPPIQDTSLAIVDASGRSLLLHAASGESVRFDVDTQTFSPADASKGAERGIGQGNVTEVSQVDFVVPSARVFDLWSGPAVMKSSELQIYAGEIKDAKAQNLSYGKGAVFVREVEPSMKASISPTVIEAPGSTGALHIFTMVEDSKLVLVDASGTPFVFDIQLQTFVPVEEVKLPRGPFFEGVGMP